MQSRRTFRDNARDVKFQIAVDVNDTSAHSAEDDGKDYNKVLR